MSSLVYATVAIPLSSHPGCYLLVLRCWLGQKLSFFCFHFYLLWQHKAVITFIASLPPIIHFNYRQNICSYLTQVDIWGENNILVCCTHLYNRNKLSKELSEKYSSLYTYSAAEESAHITKSKICQLSSQHVNFISWLNGTYYCI